MAHAGGGGGGGGSSDGLLDLEKDLTCSICTDILYQPLTLLDCLHTFCGSCLKEWFKWQAASAVNSRRSASAAPYTCPSCRESVRGTKADWRLTTLLEGYLKAHPDRGKSEEEKEEMRKHYKSGEDVLPKVEVRRSQSDSEDERLMAEVREMSIADGDPETARRRRAQRTARHGMQGRPQDGSSRVPLSEARLREHNANEPHVEHQPSLRSLLSSASPLDSHDVQQEILQSIYADGLLDGIDLDNLTTEQEEELTERIADAYRRRQLRRERSAHQERHRQNSRSPQPATAERGGRRNATDGVREPQPATVRAEGESGHRTRTDSTSAQPSARTRPPISRPHLFEQSNHDAGTRHLRSTSAVSQRSSRSAQHAGMSSPPAPPPGSRSASDLRDNPRTEEADRQRRRRLSHGNPWSITEPESRGHHVHRGRAASPEARNDAVPPNAARPLEALRRRGGSNNNSSPSLAVPAANPDEHSVRPATSNAAFAPEPLTSATPVPEAISSASIISPAPSVTCSRCERANIQYELHYRCPSCRNGDYHLCLSCYRTGQGCDHWYGFGYMANERWHRLAPPEGWPAGYERPHVLSAQRYPRPDGNATAPSTSRPDSGPQEGAFCDSCLTFANECYWYCAYCLDGAWGFCNTCVQQGRHCSHSLLPVAHLSTLSRSTYHPTDPAKTAFAPLPHLRPDSYILLPVLTDCDVCGRPIPPNRTRFHCYRCNGGDYDICTECYYHLVATGKIAQANGPGGWRRCLKGHRMAIVGYQDMSHVGQQRMTNREMVGGWRHQDHDILPGDPVPPPPSDGSLGMRCLAQWSYFPHEGVTDELGFPKNAEITEVEAKNVDWSVGVYAGRVGLFPSNHVRRIS